MTTSDRRTKADVRRDATYARARIRDLMALVNAPEIQGPEDVPEGSREVAEQDYLEAIGSLTEIALYLGLDV